MDGALFCITKRENTSNLPRITACSGEWKLFKNKNIEENSPNVVGANPKEIISDINSKGYWVDKIVIQFSEWG